MTERNKRLKRAVFPTVLSTGRRVSSQYFTAVFLKDTNNPDNRGRAVVVSKKVARLSVTRHRIKRQIQAILQTLTLPQALIIFPKLVVTKMTYKDIQTELTNLLSTIR